jgi:hypothetical protein
VIELMLFLRLSVPSPAPKTNKQKTQPNSFSLSSSLGMFGFSGVGFSSFASLKAYLRALILKPFRI